jgi:hypothetical protein
MLSLTWRKELRAVFGKKNSERAGARCWLSSYFEHRYGIITLVAV